MYLWTNYYNLFKYHCKNSDDELVISTYSEFYKFTNVYKLQSYLFAYNRKSVISKITNFDSGTEAIIPAILALDVNKNTFYNFRFLLKFLTQFTRGNYLKACIRNGTTLNYSTCFDLMPSDIILNLYYESIIYANVDAFNCLDNMVHNVITSDFLSLLETKESIDLILTSNKLMTIIHNDKSQLLFTLYSMNSYEKFELISKLIEFTIDDYKIIFKQSLEMRSVKLLIWVRRYYEYPINGNENKIIVTIRECIDFWDDEVYKFIEMLSQYSNILFNMPRMLKRYEEAISNDVYVKYSNGLQIVNRMFKYINEDSLNTEEYIKLLDIIKVLLCDDGYLIFALLCKIPSKYRNEIFEDILSRCEYSHNISVIKKRFLLQYIIPKDIPFGNIAPIYNINVNEVSDIYYLLPKKSRKLYYSYMFHNITYFIFELCEYYKYKMNNILIIKNNELLTPNKIMTNNNITLNINPDLEDEFNNINNVCGICFDKSNIKSACNHYYCMQCIVNLCIYTKSQREIRNTTNTRNMVENINERLILPCPTCRNQITVFVASSPVHEFRQILSINEDIISINYNSYNLAFLDHN